jgi:hypothetical protein
MMKLPIQGLNVDKVGSSDSESFREKKIPSLTLHSVTQETWPILHTPRDTFDVVDIDAYLRTYRLMAAYLAYLDLKLN